MDRSLHRLLLAFSLSFPLSALAALGGHVESTGNTQGQTVARTQVRAIPGNGYTIHESTTEAGITVREYAAQNGVVFAVTWNGPTLPDLQTLLGNYFPQFKNAMAERRDRGIRGPVGLKQDDLVVESGGHLRDFRGRAYAPDLLPPQVSIDEIQ